MQQRFAGGVSCASGAGARRTAMRWAMLLLAVPALSAVQACGDDDDSHDVSTGRDAGTTTSASTARDAGSDSGVMRRPTAGSNASAGSEASDTVYLCQPRAQDPGAYQREGESCCNGLGTCVTGASADPWSSRDTCSASADLRCQPVAGADAPAADSDAGAGHAPSCRVQLPGTPADGPDYEGRCVATCFVRNSPIFARLRQGSCSDGQTCSPCYNPLTGESTGICERDGDAPKDPSPGGFTECGSSGLGYCVPAYAAGAQASQLQRLTCQTGELCAPKIKVADPNACFPHCAGTLGAGACVPEFIGAGLGALLSQDSCNDGEICAPCVLFGTRIGVCD